MAQAQSLNGSVTSPTMELPATDVSVESATDVSQRNSNGYQISFPLKLQRILDKNIQLVDYECIVEEKAGRSNRLVAFGKYAGLAGMIDTFYPLGRRLVTDYGVHTPFLQCPLASMQKDLAHAKDTIRSIGEQIAYEGLPSDHYLRLTGDGGRLLRGELPGEK